MGNDESVIEQPDESGNSGTEQESKSLLEQLTKERSLKEKLITEQNEKNKKHKLLKEERETVQQQYNELKTKFDELAEQLNGSKKDLDEAKSFRLQVEAARQTEYEQLYASIPAEKQSLIPETDSVSAKLDYIKKNSKHLFDGPAAFVSQAIKTPFTVNIPPEEANIFVSLTPEERAIIANRIPEEAAAELKARNPKIFEQFLKRK